MIDKIDCSADRRRPVRKLYGQDRHLLRVFSGSANRPLAVQDG